MLDRETPAGSTRNRVGRPARVVRPDPGPPDRRARDPGGPWQPTTPGPEPSRLPRSTPSRLSSKPGRPHPLCRWLCPASAGQSRAPAPAPIPAPPLAPVLDMAAVARAEAAVDSASRERAHAEARLADAERALQAATLQAAKDLTDGKAIATTVRDPSARIAAASSKGGFLRGERDRLKHGVGRSRAGPAAQSTRADGQERGGQADRRR